MKQDNFRKLYTPVYICLPLTLRKLLSSNVYIAPYIEWQSICYEITRPACSWKHNPCLGEDNEPNDAQHVPEVEEPGKP
jgi:hypothetical protein